jgi:integrase/recombinase XerC
VGLTIYKRGETFHADLLRGGVHAVRGSLGTHNHDAALRLQRRLELALSEGPRSTLWPELSLMIPHPTFARFANFIGLKQKPLLKWKEFRDLFDSNMNQKLGIRELREKTVARYHRSLNDFELFLNDQQINMLQHIDKSLADDFRAWRFSRIKPRKGSDGKSTLDLDIAALHHVFAFAEEKGLIQENPFTLTGKGHNPDRTTKPFTKDELRAMRDHAGDDWLLFLLLRWTGFRRSDAVLLQWQEVLMDRKEIEHVCQKNSKKVILPIHSELLGALEAECRRRRPQPSETVLCQHHAMAGLLNFEVGAPDEPINGIELYQRVVALGKRCGVHAHPHRFRPTFAIDLLLQELDVFTVAKLLGDTVETVVKHYVPFVRELRERARVFLNSNRGLEQSVTPASH